MRLKTQCKERTWKTEESNNSHWAGGHHDKSRRDGKWDDQKSQSEWNAEESKSSRWAGGHRDTGHRDSKWDGQQG